MCRRREPVSRGQRPQRAEARACARRRHARGGRSRRARDGVLARRNQARGGRLRPRREASGPAHGEADAGPAGGPFTARRRRRAGGRHLSRALTGDLGARPHRERDAGAQQGHELAGLSPPRRARGATARQACTIVIAYLRGRILEKHPNRLVVDVNGVGYDVFVPLSTFYGLGDAGSEIVLRIHTHVREDALVLYGFATPLEQDLFERLISISGIGPKLALAVLSGIEPLELMRAIERGDVARLTNIPGVGKKTSERIVLELKDRLPHPPAAPTDDGASR